MAGNRRPFHAANYLETPEDQADLFNDAIVDGDPRYIAAALRAVVRARGGIAKLADDTGISRQTLNKALSEKGNPTLSTIVKVVSALGLQLYVGARTG